MTGPPVTIVIGQPTTIQRQCFLRGSGDVSAVFNSSDALAAAVVQSRQTAAVFTPSVEWYTADSTQNGYAQGQVEATFTTVQAAMLVPTVSYTLLIWRALSGSPSVLELIARIPLLIEPLAV